MSSAVENPQLFDALVWHQNGHSRLAGARLTYVDGVLALVGTSVGHLTGRKKGTKAIPVAEIKVITPRPGHTVPWELKDRTRR